MRSSLPARPPDTFFASTSLWGPPWYGFHPLDALVPERMPLACLALLAAHVVVFLGELRWGGAMSWITLHRMGASSGALVLGGEVWRLLSAGFLHLGGKHLVASLAALMVCGGYVEGLLGPSRLLLLYGASLGVSHLVMAGTAPDTLVMGSAGGVSGLLGALVVLACDPRVPIPRHCRIAPLVAGVAVVGLSAFAEGIPGRPFPTAAHVSGLVLGAGLALTGVLTWRVSRYIWRYPYYWQTPEVRSLRTGARCGVGLLGVCVALALLKGRPWEVREPQLLVRQQVPGTPVSVAVPSGARPHVEPDGVSTDGSFTDITYGQEGRDPLVVALSVDRLVVDVPEEHLEEATLRLRDTLEVEEKAMPPLKGVRVWTSPRVVVLNGRPAVFSTSAVGRVLVSSRWVMYRSGWRISLEILHERNVSEGWRARMEEMSQSVVVREEDPSL